MVQERARIARELHDVIAHNVSMMVVQAGAERRALNGESASTREVLSRSRRPAGERSPRCAGWSACCASDGPDPLLPQPSLADLPRLVGQLRSAGLPVELHVDGERRALPAGIELSAYRIVQEALTNCLKHAGDAAATVRVGYAPDALELEIADDGSRRWSRGRRPPDMGSSACASGSRSTEAASTPARGPRVGSSSASCCRSR